MKWGKQVGSGQLMGRSSQGAVVTCRVASPVGVPAGRPTWLNSKNKEKEERLSNGHAVPWRGSISEGRSGNAAGE